MGSDAQDKAPIERKLAAILAADVVGYSRLMGVDEEATLAQLKSHRRELIDPKLAEYRGRVVKTTGDGLLVEFASIVDAARCAVDVQQAMAERNAAIPKDRRIEFRIGLNLGDIIIDENDIYGDGVNVAARLEALAPPGGICVSRSVHDHVRDKIAIPFVDMGEQQVKNIARPLRVFCIDLYASASAAPRRQKSVGARWAIGLCAAAVVAVAAILGMAQYLREPDGLALPDRPSIAVLPFANISSDPKEEYFSDGITEDIITALSRFSGLFVIARNSTFAYKDQAVDISEVGRKLGVRYVLEGSVRREGDRVRVTAQLIDAQTGAHQWAEKYDRELAGIFSVQDDITQQIVGNLVAQVSKAETGRSLQKPPDKLDAYDFYLRAEAMNRQAALDRKAETLAEVRRLHELSLNADAHYARAWAGLAENYLKAWLEPYNAKPFTDEFQKPATLDRALEYARRSVELNADLPEAYATLGLILHWKRDPAAAIDAFSKAFSLNPNLSFPRYGDVLVYAGQPADAIGVVQTSMRLDPLHTPNSFAYLGHAHLMNGDAEAAIEALLACVRGSPLFRPAHVWLTAAYQVSGRTDEAKAASAQLLKLQPSFTVDSWMKFVQYKNPANATFLADNLRAAGVP